MDNFHPDTVEYDEICTTYGAFYESSEAQDPETDRIRDVHRYGDIEEHCNAANLFSMVGKSDGQRVKEDPNGRFHFWKTFAMHILAGCNHLQVKDGADNNQL
jgi:hypothetical protein